MLWEGSDAGRQTSTHSFLSTSWHESALTFFFLCLYPWNEFEAPKIRNDYIVDLALRGKA
jgi:hypothetical protein